jgi:hypothetical protein
MYNAIPLKTDIYFSNVALNRSYHLIENTVVSITKTNRLLFRETIDYYCKNYTKHIKYTLCKKKQILDVTAGGTYITCLERLKQKVNVYLPSLMMKVPNHLYVLGDTYK